MNIPNLMKHSYCLFFFFKYVLNIYRMSFSSFNTFTTLSNFGLLTKQIKANTTVTGYIFRVKGNSAVVPTTDLNNKALINTGTVTMVNDPIRGYVFNFSGSNHLRIDVPTPTPHTRTLWVSSSTPEIGRGQLFSSQWIELYFDGTNNLKTDVTTFDAFSNDRLTTQIISTVSQNTTWTFYALVVDAASSTLYVNGVASTPKQHGSGNPRYRDDTFIQFGSSTLSGNNHTGNYSGYLDDMRLYPSVLTASEITAIYNEA
jgi:hypothetical protein